MAAPATPIRKVHLIFKTHLDVGYTDFAARVLERSLQDYIPKAIRVARELAQAGKAESFTWTTGSWLVVEYLERANAQERAQLEAAIAAGWITWHALPVTLHSELLDPALFRYGLSLSRRLDERFGRRTIAAKMTDVPGHTRGIVPLLVEAGVQFLHIGVNAASMPPAVPDVFRWRDPASGAEIMVMYHKGSYGDLMLVPGLDEAILFAHTGDNLGPQTADEVRAIYRETRRRFPGAEVTASTLDAYAAALVRVRGSLPVVTQEIGDTWIHGGGTDPKKVARYRELLRLRRRWQAAGQELPEMFSRSLLLVPEHTWGLDVKTHLGDPEHFRTAEFQAQRNEPNYRKLEASWAEQRAYIDSALAALGDSPLAAEAQAALAGLEPVRPALSTYELLDDPGELFETPHFTLAFDIRGALAYLRQQEGGRLWANPAHPLALLRYQTFSQADYDRFFRQYIHNKHETLLWALGDFTKPGMDGAGAESRDWLPRLQALYWRPEAAGVRFLTQMALPEEASALYGCPREAYLTIYLPDAEPALYLDLQWFDKPACRLPEALWLSFCPPIVRARGWTMEKMGQWLSPLDIVRNGNRHLHAVGQGVRYADRRGSLTIETLDAPLVAPGERSLLDFDNRRPPLHSGMHFNLYNNLWGTNFPMWYGEDARFRFVIRNA